MTSCPQCHRFVCVLVTRAVRIGKRDVTWQECVRCHIEAVRQ